jgi:hypothetical protein
MILKNLAERVNEGFFTKIITMIRNFVLIVLAGLAATFAIMFYK